MTTLPAYTLKITRRARQVSLRIDHRGLTIVTPRKLTDLQISQILHEHRDWLAGNLDYLRQAHDPDLKLNDGMRIDLEGESMLIRYYPLSYISSTRPQVKIIQSELMVFAADGGHGEILTKWMIKRARVIFCERVEAHAKTHGFEYSGISIRDQSSRWGSCSSLGNLNFNWRLLLAPPQVLDYVIVHELAHTREMNHSQRFWETVESVMPTFREARSWLRDHGGRLHLY